MIKHALEFLRSELDIYIKSLPGHNDPKYVTLGNVALMDSDNNDALRNTLLLTLVNVEEESTLKNIKVMHKQANGATRFENPPVHLNLYILVSANFPDNYDNALIRLSQAIRFFQGKRLFNLQNAVGNSLKIKATDPDEPERLDIQEMEIVLDLYTMTFEQINHLWGSLGGKQIPFAMYKARLVKLREPHFTGDAPPIEIIRQEARPLDNSNTPQ
ncbi:MAG: DUF4255 domain-containing protein [Saprospiraceae bacterium]